MQAARFVSKDHKKMNTLILSLLILQSPQSQFLVVNGNNPSHWYNLESSTNLVDWTVECEFNNSGDQAFEQISIDPNKPQMFYRVEDLGANSPLL